VTGAVVWLTGLPASGKSTLAGRVAEGLRARGRATLLLDGDEVRGALAPAPGFDDAGRDDFYVTLGNLATLAARQGLIAIVAATAHRRRWRDRVREVAPRFVEIHVATTLDECRRRDPKGLYAAGLPAMPGDALAYEAPVAPEIVASGGEDRDAAVAVIARVDA
jgi:adenylylsulfate kinase